MNPVSEVLIEDYLRNYPEEAGSLLEKAPPEIVGQVLERFPAACSGKVLPQVHAHVAAAILDELPAKRAGEALESMAFDHAIVLLRLVNPKARTRIMAAANPYFAEKAWTLLVYPEDCVGAFMDPFALTLRESLTAEEALDLLQLFADKLRNYLYVLDDGKRLKGVMSIRQLLPLKPKALIRDVMKYPVLSVSPYVKLRELAEHPGWNSFRLLPVADGNGIFHGVLKYETMTLKSRAAASGESAERSTGRALGELYGVGIQAVFQSAMGLARPDGMKHDAS